MRFILTILSIALSISVAAQVPTQVPDIIEGRWELTTEGAIEIHRDTCAGNHPSQFIISIADSPDRSLLPGTVIGSCHKSAVANKYVGKIYSKYQNGKLSNLRQIIFNLNDPSHLSFIDNKKGVKLNIRRILSYMTRGALTYESNHSSDDLDGATRRYAAPSSHKPSRPRHL